MWLHVYLFVLDDLQHSRGKATHFVNLTESDLRERVVGPWERGDTIVWNGRQVETSIRTSIRITQTPDRIPDDGTLPPGDEVTNEWIKSAAGTSSAVADDAAFAATRDPSKVMVVHGRNGRARDAMFSFLRAVGLAPVEWEQAISATGMASPHNLEAVRAAMRDSQAVVVLLTAEDRAGLIPALADQGAEEPLRGQPRQNVILEAGLAMGIAPERTILVQLGDLRTASDFDGLNHVRLSNQPGPRHALRSRLRDAGCRVDDTAADWLDPGAGGNFDGAVVRPLDE